MPRAVNPGTLANGGGLAAQKSVEASAFVHPTQGLDGLIAHIVDPSRAHEARAINLVDAGGFYSSDNVEGALQEIGGGLASTGQNGVLEGCTFTAAGLTITLATPSTVRIGTERDLSGASITLTDGATCWVYVNTSGTLTHTTGPTPPSFSSPENVLLWKVVTNAGTISSQTDMRWFVLNIDRKPFLTVRSAGTDANKHSEASFETLEGAMLYLEHFGAGDMRTHTVIIKGPMTISSSIVVPVNNVIFRGEDNCTLTTGAVLTPMFDVSGRTRVTFQDIVFTSDHATSTAIGVSTFATGILVERCSIASGAGTWDVGLDWDSAAAVQQCVVRNCSITAAVTGIRAEFPVDCRIEDTIVSDATGSGTYGIKLGPLAGGIGVTANNQIRGCRTTGFTAAGVAIRSLRMKVLSTTVLDTSTNGLSVGPNSDDVVIADSTFLPSATTGVTGILLSGGDNIKIRDCRIQNQRSPAAYTVEVPAGITVANGVDQVSIQNCQITNFLNTVTPGGYGVFFAGSSNNSLVQGCVINTIQEGIYCAGTTDRFRVVGCDIEGAYRGLYLQGNSTVGDTSIRLNSSRAMYGIDVTGSNVNISNVRIQNPRAANSYGALDIPIGIQITGDKALIQNTDISGFWNSNYGTNGNGYCVAGIGSNITVDGGNHDTALTAVTFVSGSNYTASNLNIINCDGGIRAQGPGTLIANCNIVGEDPSASVPGARYGVEADANNVTVTGCRIVSSRTTFSGGDTPIAIWARAEYLNATNNIIRGWRDVGNTTGYGFYCEDSPSGHFVFTGNTVETCYTGFSLTVAALASQVTVANNEFRDLDQEGIITVGSNNVSITDNLLIDVGTANAIYVAYGTDIEITGNTIDGAATTDSGITLTGTDGPATRTRRFVVSNNTIRAFTGRGISVIDYVQNGVISGNHIDGFIAAAPTDYSSIACVVIEGLSSGNIPKYIEFTGNTLWRSKNGVMVYGVDVNNPITNVSIQGNNIHHCAAGYNVGTVSCIAIDTFWVEDVSILNNDIDRMGRVISNSDVESFPAAGPNVTPMGIRVRNGSRINISQNNLSDIMRNGSGFATCIQFENRDTGSTLGARSLTLSGNSITTSAGVANPPHIGISVASGQETSGTGAATSIFNLNIEDNTIRRMLFEGILVFAAGGSVVQQVNISGNAVSQLTDATFGIGIWVGTGKSTAFGGGALREVVIANNNVANTGHNGIWVTSDENTSVTHVAIRGNTVADTGARGIEVYEGSFSTSTVLSTEFGNFIVDGNTISGPTTQGIRFYSLDFDLSDITVTNNVVTGANGAGCPQKALELAVEASTEVTGTAVAGGASTITLAGGPLTDDYYVGWEVTITGGTGSGQNRTITDYDGTTKVATVDTAWGTPPDGTSTYALLRVVAPTRWTVSNNRFYGDGTATLIDVLVDGILTGFTFTDNQCHHPVDTTFRVLNLDLNPSGSIGSEKFAGNWVWTGNTFFGGTGVDLAVLDGLKLWNVNFSNNTVAKSASTGFALDMDDLAGGGPGTLPSVSNFTMDSNIFESGGISGALEAIRLFFGDGADQVAPVADVSVTNNRIQLWNNTAGNDPRALWVRCNARVIGMNITGNTLQANGNVDNAVQGTAGMIDVELGQDGAISPYASRNINISGNVLTGNFGGYGIWVHKASIATNAYVRGLRVCNNEIHGGFAESGIFSFFFAGDAVRVDLTGFTSDGANTPILPGDIVLDGNVIHTNKHNAVASVSDVGIHFIGPAGATLENVSISNNSLSDTGNGDGTTSFGALNLDINDPVINLKVDGNLINSPPTNGVYINSSGQLRVVSVSGNQIDTPTGNGIYVTVATAAVVQCSIKNNMIRSASGSGVASIYVNTDAGLTDLEIDNNNVAEGASTTASIHVRWDGVWTNGSVSNNTIGDSTAGAGIYLLCDAIDIPCGLLNVGVNGNRIKNSAAQGIRVYGTTASFTPSLDRLSVCDNLIEDPGADGISVEVFSDATLQHSSISRNQIHNSDGTGISLQWSGGGGGSALTEVAVSDNVIVSPNGSGVSLVSLVSGNTLTNISIHNNTIRDTANHGIILAGSDMSNLSIVGNNIRNFSTGPGTYGGINIWGNGVSYVNVSSNVVRDEGSNLLEGYWFICTGQLRSWAVVGNVSHLGDAAASESLRFDTGAGTDQASMTFVGNTTRAAATGWNFNASSFSPDRSILVGNTDRTTGGAGNLAAFGAVFTNSQVANNQD